VARQPTSFGAKLDFCLCGSRGSLGFAESAGDIVMFLDADDLLAPEAADPRERLAFVVSRS